ncbi:MAG: alpha/beta fold hydrolase [Acidobacteriota bacterium]
MRTHALRFAAPLLAAAAICLAGVSPVIRGLAASETPDALTIDHYVGVKSAVPSMNGEMAQLYVRERAPAVALRRAVNTDRVVLFVHGAGTPAEVAFDTPADGFSWMAYLADAGFDTFSVDMTGYGRSTRPTVMNDPCNLSAEQQAQFVPSLLLAPCAASYAHPATTIASDWNDVGAAVDYVRALRHVDRVHLVAWSLGAPRAAGYAAQNPQKVGRLVLLAPAYAAGASPTPPTPMPANGTAFNTQSLDEFAANWDRQVGCPNQYDVSTRDAVWSAMVASDPVGATWGSGVRRAPSTTTWGWNAAMAGQLKAPVLTIAGQHDKQVLPERVRELHAALGSAEKVSVDLACSSHNAMWELNHTLMFKASREWLLQGSVNAQKQGIVKVGY